MGLIALGISTRCSDSARDDDGGSGEGCDNVHIVCSDALRDGTGRRTALAMASVVALAASATAARG